LQTSVSEQDILDSERTHNVSNNVNKEQGTSIKYLPSRPKDDA